MRTIDTNNFGGKLCNCEKTVGGNINFCHQIITWQIKEPVATTSYRNM
jgi:hypothetical protein